MSLDILLNAASWSANKFLDALRNGLADPFKKATLADNRNPIFGGASARSSSVLSPLSVVSTRHSIMRACSHLRWKPPTQVARNLTVVNAIIFRRVWDCMSYQLQQTRSQEAALSVNCSSIGGLIRPAGQGRVPRFQAWRDRAHEERRAR